ncbi:MAG: hypothetical protein CMC96_00260 [Flavobacteriales bacterium]|nr:hypothetical protein [Flavobacteriales bacterium]|tara:strand:+ start:342 stop:875 length:534 start_codon:yes stop_codon:yes gene_type:complete
MPLADITTIEQLNKNLNLGPGYDGYIELVNSIKLPKEVWEKHCKWSDEEYTRNCLTAYEGHEVILMCWKKGQIAPIHTYALQEGWIKVLEGELVIETFIVDRENKTAELNDTIYIKAGESTYLNDGMGFHRAYSAVDKTVSLHLHIEKIQEWEEFDPERKTFKKVKPRYDSKTEYCE